MFAGVELNMDEPALPSLESDELCATPTTSGIKVRKSSGSNMLKRIQMEESSSPLISDSRSAKRLLRKNVSFQTPTLDKSQTGSRMRHVRKLTPYRPGSSRKIERGSKKDGETQTSMCATPDYGSCHRKIATPNFKRIHQKAFDDLESIQEYYQRTQASHKKRNAASKPQLAKQGSGAKNAGKSGREKSKSKGTAGVSGVPFVSSKTSPSKLKALPKDTKSSSSKRDGKAEVFRFNAASKSSSGKENIVKAKKKFDLKASLAKRLAYKPHTGPLKPFSDKQKPIQTDQPSGGKGEVVPKMKTEKREVLKGIRKNKRFELQMKNRK